jgi:hypothetical protein
MLARLEASPCFASQPSWLAAAGVAHSPDGYLATPCCSQCCTLHCWCGTPGIYWSRMLQHMSRCSCVPRAIALQMMVKIEAILPLCTALVLLVGGFLLQHADVDIWVLVAYEGCWRPRCMRAQCDSRHQRLHMTCLENCFTETHASAVPRSSARLALVALAGTQQCMLHRSCC